MTWTVILIFPLAIAANLGWVYYKSANTTKPEQIQETMTLNPDNWGTIAQTNHDIIKIVYYLRDQGNAQQFLDCTPPITIKKGEFFTWKELFARCGGAEVFATAMADEQKRLEHGEAKLEIIKK